MIDYVKQKIIFVRGQNPYRASKLTVKKYFSGIHAGISASRSVKATFTIVWCQCDIQIDFDNYFFIFQSPPMLESFHLSFENLTMSQVTPTQQLITYQ